MPYRLKFVLLEYGITHQALADAVSEASGHAFSRTSISQLINYRYYPRHSTEETVRGWIAAQLRQHGVPDEQIAAAWDDAGDGELWRRHPRGSHVVDRPLRLRAKPDEIEFEPVESQMLSPLAKRHFKLFRDPFNCDPEGPEDVFLGPDQQTALHCLDQAVLERRLFAWVGESGSGKTTLIDLWKDRIRTNSRPIRIVQPMLPDKAALTGSGILSAIVRDLAPNAKLRARNEDLTRQAHDLLVATSEAGTLNVLLFEEAHDLSIHALKQLKRFHEFKTDWTRLLAIVLVGQPELMGKLGEHGAQEIREVANRLERMQLLPLDTAVSDYIGHRLVKHKLRVCDLFTDEAIFAMNQRLQGVRGRGQDAQRVPMTYPLLVNNLCVKALNAAAELGAERVDASIIRGC